MFNLHAKFEVFSLNRFRDMDKVQHCKSRSRDPFLTSYDLILHYFR